MVGTESRPPREPGSVEWDDQWAVPVDGEPVYEQDSELVRAQVQTDWDQFRRHVITHRFSEESLLHGIEKIYSTSQTAAFFGRSNQWIYWGLTPNPETGVQPFSYRNGDPILPERVGKGGWRRFTLPIIREIAMCCFRRGTVKEEELTSIMAKILLAEFGPNAFREG